MADAAQLPPQGLLSRGAIRARAGPRDPSTRLSAPPSALPPPVPPSAPPCSTTAVLRLRPTLRVHISSPNGAGASTADDEEDEEEGTPVHGGNYLTKRANNRCALVPVLDDDNARADGILVFEDETMLLDKLWAFSPRVARGVMRLNLIAFAAAMISWLLMPFVVPFAILEYTNTTHVLLAEQSTKTTVGDGASDGGNGGNGGSGGNGGNGSIVPGTGVTNISNDLWDPAWSDVAIVLADIIHCIISLFCVIHILIYFHWGTFRLLVKEEWPGMVVTLSSSVAYAAVAGSLQSHHAHICTLVFSKFFYVLWVMLQDVISVYVNPS